MMMVLQNRRLGEHFAEYGEAMRGSPKERRLIDDPHPPRGRSRLNPGQTELARCSPSRPFQAKTAQCAPLGISNRTSKTDRRGGRGAPFPA